MFIRADSDSLEVGNAEHEDKEIQVQSRFLLDFTVIFSVDMTQITSIDLFVGIWQANSAFSSHYVIISFIGS
jgi:hypothetical protein